MFSGLTSRCITFLERKKQRLFKHRYKITPIASLLNRSSLLCFAKSLSHGLEYDLAVIVERDMKHPPADAILGDTAINVTYPFVAAENEALARIFRRSVECQSNFWFRIIRRGHAAALPESFEGWRNVSRFFVRVVPGLWCPCAVCCY